MGFESAADLDSKPLELLVEIENLAWKRCSGAFEGFFCFELDFVSMLFETTFKEVDTRVEESLKGV